MRLQPKGAFPVPAPFQTGRVSAYKPGDPPKERSR
jgi:hypothetical protein